MSNIITIGYSTEGTTDRRFLENVIKNTFEDVAFDSLGAVEVYAPIYIDFPRGNFNEAVLKLSKTAADIGVYVLCIHVDADSQSDHEVFTNKINPAMKTIEQAMGDNLCDNIVAIVPIQMTESWLLADKELFKREIGTGMSDNDLKINKDPESIADPKQVIEEALRIAQNHLPSRRKKIKIGDIYQPIGQNLTADKLGAMESYRKFKNAVIEAFRRLNYLT
ncbi:MAG: DUF4276 family protein [Bacteroidetes bacterium]|nr:DUF4276 family protein [Bacteroidota bacterium]